MSVVRQRRPVPDGWPLDAAGRPLRRCPDARQVGHEAGHWWACHLKPANPVEGVRFLYCPPPSPVAYGRSG